MRENARRVLGQWAGRAFAWLLIWIYPAWRLVESASAADWLMNFLPPGLVAFIADLGWIVCIPAGFFILDRLGDRRRALFDLETSFVEFLRRLGEFDQRAHGVTTIAGASELAPSRRRMLMALTEALRVSASADQRTKDYKAMLDRVGERLRTQHPEVPQGGDFNVHDALKLAADLTPPVDQPPTTEG